MDYLLDKKIFWYALYSPEKLSKKIISIISNKKNKIYFSTTTIETLFLNPLEKNSFLPSQLINAATNRDTGFICISPDKEDYDTWILSFKNSSNYFKHILIAQCQNKNLTLITDRKIANKINVPHIYW